MPDMEKIIYDIERCTCHVPDACRDCSHYTGTVGFGCMENLIKDVLDLLKEQEDLGKELTNAVELIHKKNERIEKLLKEQETANIYKCPNCGTWVSAENVVRCRDCKHWYFADNRIPSEQENVCGRNGIVVTPDWFCADGERGTE